MPYAVNQGTRLYWTEYGEGTPILLIMGLSFTHEMWYRVLTWLTPGYRAIVFDNRGMGRSDVPPGPYSIPQMASDAAAVMDAAGISAAHVVGASMGGMIAQELALRTSGPGSEPGARVHELSAESRGNGPISAGARARSTGGAPPDSNASALYGRCSMPMPLPQSGSRKTSRFDPSAAGHIKVSSISSRES